MSGIHRTPEQRPGRGACAALLLGVVGGLMPLAGSAAQAAPDSRLLPFEASYTWVWSGMAVAVSTLKLQHSGDTWSYDSHSEPRGIGRIFSERPTQHSELRIGAAGAQPLLYRAGDGTRSTKRSVDLHYDWQQGRVTGVYENIKVDLPLSSGIQDDASVQVALMVDLLSGHDSVQFKLLDRDSVRDYRFTREAQVTLPTALGEVATVVYRAQKQGSPRVTRFWCDPARGYVPLKVEQTRGDDVQWTMLIQSLQRGSE